MAFNPAASFSGDVSIGLEPSSRLVHPNSSRTLFSFGDENLYHIRPARRDSSPSSSWDRTNYYWDASLPVRSMASFEAQLYAQTNSITLHSNTLPARGSAIYSDTANILEAATTLWGDGDQTVQGGESSASINLVV